MNAIIYFIAYTVAGSLSIAPLKDTRCWDLTGDCWWAKRQAICARTYGDAAQFLQQSKISCQLGVEKRFQQSGF